MSAIVAKAVNDSIGTQDFKGLNTILEEQLDKFVSSMIEELPKSIEDSIKGSAIPFYVATDYADESSNGSFIKHNLLRGYRKGTDGKIGKTYVFKGSGTIAVSHSAFDGGYFYLEKNGERTKIQTSSETGMEIIGISPNDSLSFYEGAVEMSSLSISMLVFQNAGIIIS